MAENVSRRSVFRASAGAAVFASSASVSPLPATPAAAAEAAPGAAVPAARRAVSAARAPLDAKTELRVQKLLSRMTVEEKFGQLQQLTWNPDTGPGEAQNEAARDAASEGRLGSVLNITGAQECNELQRFAVEESRLGIPLVFGLDVIHGFLTTFPVPLAQGASFDPGVVVKDAEVSAREAASWGVHWTFAPMADVSREPRWGRVAEGSGEDPYLTAELTAAKVRGYQGEDYGADGRLAACAKHFVGYGFPEGGRDYNTVDISERRLRDVALPPFKAAVDAGVATVMAAFNTVNGVPAHANRHTLTGILHDELDFDGFVVGDYNGVQELIPHGVAAGEADAARLALGAGVDMEMVSTTYADHGKELLESGEIDLARLDDAVTRILRIKVRLGLFEKPYTDEDGQIDEPSAAARRDARQTAAACAVLLKNEERTLPFEKGVSSLAVVGPLGDDTQELHGTWAGPGARKFPAVSVLEGIRKAAPDAKVTFARGCGITGDDTDGFEKAVAAVRASDAAVVVVGEKASHSGEAAVRSDITLPGVQTELVRRIAATGKPFVVVVLAGRPLVLSGIVEHSPAILNAWHPGLEGGNAVADVLFGKVNPGAKLPATFPRAVGQIAEYYAHENTGRPYDPDNSYTSKYLDLPHGPLFPFGHGLSYTTFGYSELALGEESLSARAVREGDATVTVTVKVKNTGSRAGDEVVQLYIRDKVASLAQPVRRLRGFERITLEAGEQRTVAFELGADDLGFHTNDPKGELLVEPGEFEIYAGGSSEAGLNRTLTLI